MAAPPTGPGGKDAAVHDHLALMTGFLQGQERVAGTALGAPAPIRRRIEVLDLSGHFNLPFAYRAYLMKGLPSPEALRPWLSPAEQIEAAEMAQKRGWTDWALARLAVKQAAAALMGTGVQAGLQVVKDARGAPHLASLSGLEDPPTGPLPAISIAHAEGTGLGLAAPAGWQVGIDFDLPGRIRNPAEFLATVLAPDEARALNLAPDAGNAALVWCLKEAAAKALGLGIQGRPQAFVLQAYDPVTGRAQLSHDGVQIVAELRQLGAALCALAYVPHPAPRQVAVPAA